MGTYTAQQHDIITRSKLVACVVNKNIPPFLRRACSIWQRGSDSVMSQEKGNTTSLSATDIVISEFPDMPKVMDALGLLPERFSEEDGFGNYHPYGIIVIPTDTFKQLKPGDLTRIADALADAADHGVSPLLDERSPAAPLRCVPGTYEKIHGRYYTFNKADIQLLETDIVLDEEIAYSLLRHKLVMICRSAYGDLVPRQKGKQKKSYKMKAVGRCCEFATLLSCGRDDFSDLKKRAAHETDRARVLTNVRLAKENFPESLHGMYGKISRLEDIAELWRAACADGNRGFAFNFADIDEGAASEKMDEIAKTIGIDSFFDAWEAGVPVEDISA